MKVKIAGAWKEILGIWCKVSGVWKPISGIWNKVSGVFREETGAALGTGTLSGIEVSDNKLELLKNTIGDYYNEGVEGVLWVTGYTYQSGEISKGADHIYLNAYYDGKYSERTAVTDVAVDLTNAYKVKIDWYNDSSTGSSSKRRSAFVVSTEKMSSLATYDARIHREGPFSRRVDEIDVSGLTGNYYLRVHSRGEDGYVNRVYLYKVWAEDAVGNILYEYNPSGYRIWQPLDLSAAITAAGSLIEFSKVTPTDTNLKVYALLAENPAENLIQALLYDEGTEYVPFVEWTSIGTGAQSKEDNHLYLEAERVEFEDPEGRRGWVTDVKVDLTDYDRVIIESEKAGSGFSLAQIIVSEVKFPESSEQWAASVNLLENHTRSVNTLDVSGLSGEYYIMLDIVKPFEFPEGPDIFKIYRVGLGEEPAEPGVDDPRWEEQSDSTALTVVTEGADMVGKLLYLKVEMSTTDPSVTPSLSRWYALVLGNGTTQWIKVS